MEDIKTIKCTTRLLSDIAEKVELMSPNDGTNHEHLRQAMLNAKDREHQLHVNREDLTPEDFATYLNKNKVNYSIIPEGY